MVHKHSHKRENNEMWQLWMFEEYTNCPCVCVIPTGQAIKDRSQTRRGGMRSKQEEEKASFPLTDKVCDSLHCVEKREAFGMMMIGKTTKCSVSINKVAIIRNGSFPSKGVYVCGLPFLSSSSIHPSIVRPSSCWSLQTFALLLFLLPWLPRPTDERECQT